VSEDTKTHKARPLKYAVSEGVEQGSDKLSARPIEYAITRPGAQYSIVGGRDDPLSANFVPLTERTENDRARFWAQWSRRKHAGRPPAGVFDA
jgi:hypothetical protein